MANAIQLSPQRGGASYIVSSQRPLAVSWRSSRQQQATITTPPQYSPPHNPHHPLQTIVRAGVVGRGKIGTTPAVVPGPGVTARMAAPGSGSRGRPDITAGGNGSDVACQVETNAVRSSLAVMPNPGRGDQHGSGASRSERTLNVPAGSRVVVRSLQSCRRVRQRTKFPRSHGPSNRNDMPPNDQRKVNRTTEAKPGMTKNQATASRYPPHHRAAAYIVSSQRSRAVSWRRM